MQVYDKASWHIDAGENETDVIHRFKIIFEFLSRNNMLSDEGLEILEIGIEDSISLHERLLNETGRIFMNKNYDGISGIDNKSLLKELDSRIGSKK